MKSIKTIMLLVLILTIAILTSCENYIEQEFAETSAIAINSSQTDTSMIDENAFTDEFCDMINGIWVDQNSCSSYASNEAMFSFYSFSDGMMYSATYPGSKSRTGEIIEVVELTNNLYKMILYYPEIDSMGMHYDEERIEYEINIDGKSIFFSNYPDYIYTYMGEDLDSAKQAVVLFCQESAPVVDIYLPFINTSVSDYLQKYLYLGGNYLSDWESSVFLSENSIYNFGLTGTETHYYLYNEHFTIMAREDKVAGAYQGGLHTLNLQNTYQLLTWLGGNYTELINYDPELIYTDQYNVYLKWETKNGYMVISTIWYDGLTDWKNSIPRDYCVFAKNIE